ncbi:cobalt transport protein [Alkaliphilus metalliredigens QYMF]|uniref:Cobalt transport protein n=1 Tax=Alkaliphilus metalliredigens (strain QYMF) TaxID=293826 RepID=A6TKN3_ALKMQ|nr:energy-coupling factor transporter transmembrane component T [Alkaliphilus metalliredigens]ABR46751.1 cobalt transport protein [Alkaliphilus metalliredigens QYMF]
MVSTKPTKRTDYHNGHEKLISWGRNWETRTKIMTCFMTAFGLIGLDKLSLLIFSFSLLLLIVISMGFSIKYILSKLVLLLPFLALMSVPLIIGPGFPVTNDRFVFPLILTLKALSVSLLMFIMILSQPLQQFLNALSHMHLPPFFISILFLSWRYTFVLWDTLKNTQSALVSRLFNTSFRKRTFKTYGEVMGGILIKSIDRSEKLYRAMIARGFSGRISSSKPQSITRWDIIKSFLFVGVIISLNIIEKWWFV